MPCYKPMYVRITKEKTANGKKKVIFKKQVPEYLRSNLSKNENITLPCGQCVGCRLERSRQWAMRCMHEAKMHEENCFITLTYNEDNVPLTLVKADVQKFIKRLRQKFKEKKIRYYMCGEYAPIIDQFGRTIKNKLGRPHYHILLFGFDFKDKLHWTTKRGHKLYISEDLNKLWKFGYSLIGSVTFESAQYVARYILKKVLGNMAKEYYKGKVPEYTAMSRRKGIGRTWFEKYCKDIYPRDRVIIGGRECKPAKYYDQIFDLMEPEEFAKIKEIRKREMFKHQDDNTPKRLQVKEVVAIAKLKNSKRKLEK